MGKTDESLVSAKRKNGDDGGDGPIAKKKKGAKRTSQANNLRKLVHSLSAESDKRKGIGANATEDLDRIMHIFIVEVAEVSREVASRNGVKTVGEAEINYACRTIFSRAPLPAPGSDEVPFHERASAYCADGMRKAAAAKKKTVEAAVAAKK